MTGLQEAFEELDGKYINQNMINANSGVAGLNRYGYLPTDLVQVSPQVQESSPMPVTSGAVYAAIQDFVTASVSNLINYYTKSQTYSKSEVDSLISSIKQFTYQSADSLPTASASTMYKIYLIPAANSETNNAKDEYITVENGSSYSWEKIGSTNIDLSGYYQKPASGIPASDLASGVIPDISGKADKSEMSIVAGTDENSDKTTITLKSGTSATVLTQHQDISEFLKEGEVFGIGDDSTASFNPYADTVWNKEQVLSAVQKQQIQENIGISDALATKADISNTYTKSEVNSLIIPQGVDSIPVVALPVTGAANTLYFVQGTDSFTINAWDGTAWVTLATIAGTYDAGGALS